MLRSHKLGMCSFHSINIPSEWGLFNGAVLPQVNYVSIQLISPASGDDYINITDISITCFHSINIPSEWGQKKYQVGTEDWTEVSIQLISPASGILGGILLDPSAI